MYRIAPWLKSMSTSYITQADTSYTTLVARFGDPYLDRCLDHKSTTEWVVEDDMGRIFTVYDYEGDICRDAEQLRTYTDRIRSEHMYRWHIGSYAAEGAEDLVNFIRTGSEDRQRHHLRSEHS